MFLFFFKGLTGPFSTKVGSFDSSLGCANSDPECYLDDYIYVLYLCKLPHLVLPSVS